MNKQALIPSISILGCGWLGLPLAKRLLKESFIVRGSTTSKSKADRLINEGIKASVLQYNPHAAADIGDFFSSETLFLNIPFRRTLDDPRFYVEQIKAALHDAQKGMVRFVIFASSTSIYAEHIKEAREDSPLDLSDDRRRVLNDVEQFLLGLNDIKATILRFGGLVGGSRQIGRFLAGAKDLTEPQRAVNLIHLDDCIEIILSVIRKNITGEIFNAVCDKHPTRKELYTHSAANLGLEVPQFSVSDSLTSGKIVINDKLKKELAYSFIHPDPFNFPL